MAGTLFIVGTPIGNLEDLTERARRTLASVDLIAAEDTRRAGTLLKGLGISSRLVSLFDANEADRTPELLTVLREGRDVAIVSDGGMPLVSDPGYRVVAAATAAGIGVRVVPGPSAAIAALVISGLAVDRWAFEGFLPKKAVARRRRLESVADDTRTLVFFESPRRVADLLTAVIDVLGDRRVAVCRELTKLHEETKRGPASRVLAALVDGPLRGEVVVVVAGAADPGGSDTGAAAEQARALVAGGQRPRQAARDAANAHGVAANDVYRALLETEEP